jgi:hypothetical protein
MQVYTSRQDAGAPDVVAHGMVMFSRAGKMPALSKRGHGRLDLLQKKKNLHQTLVSQLTANQRICQFE